MLAETTILARVVLNVAPARPPPGILGVANAPLEGTKASVDAVEAPVDGRFQLGQRLGHLPEQFAHHLDLGSQLTGLLSHSPGQRLLQPVETRGDLLDLGLSVAGNGCDLGKAVFNPRPFPPSFHRLLQGDHDEHQANANHQCRTCRQAKLKKQHHRGRGGDHAHGDQDHRR